MCEGWGDIGGSPPSPPKFNPPSQPQYPTPPLSKFWPPCSLSPPLTQNFKIFQQKLRKKYAFSLKMRKNSAKKCEFHQKCAFCANLHIFANFAHFWWFFAKILRIFGDFSLFTSQALLSPLSTLLISRHRSLISHEPRLSAKFTSIITYTSPTNKHPFSL